MTLLLCAPRSLLLLLRRPHLAQRLLSAMLLLKWDQHGKLAASQAKILRSSRMGPSGVLLSSS